MNDKGIIKKLNLGSQLFIVGLVVVVIISGMLIWQQVFNNKMTQVVVKPVVEKAINGSVDANKIKPAEMNPSDGMTLLFDKQEYITQVNEKFSLIARDEPNGKKINAVDLHIAFDPNLLKLESVEPTEEFSLVLSESRIDNEKGVASIALGVPLEKKSSAILSDMVVFNFQAISSGRAVVSFSDKAVAAAEGEAGNVVSIRGAAIINIK